ncbi:MAG: class I SAM-dependent methyltransferase [Treponema sp.]|nr:class I SAM-dependent methyltransferase [Treponema sp.]
MEEAAKNAAQAEMLYNRVQKRFRHLKKWAKRTGNEVFRLYDRDIPEIPLVLDWYGGAVSGALYRRPYQKDAAEEALWTARMRDAAARALDISPDRIYLKERRRQQGRAQYQKFSGAAISRHIREGGLLFQANLSDYLDTGLFPDRRLLRNRVREEAKGKRILNLFCYTAVCSVYAARGGAAEVDSVDISNTYLAWGAENFALNGLRAQWIGPPGASPPLPYRLIRMDALRFIHEARQKRSRWDIIILDPPAFSNSKKMRGSLDIKRDHQDLIGQCLGLIADGGILYFSAPPRHFRLSLETFPQAAVRDITGQIRDEDFRGKKIPPCYQISLP